MEKGFQYVKEKLRQLSTDAGCYLMKDYDNRIFYIGKAKNLRARLKSYFSGQDTRIFVQFLEQMLADIDIIVVRNDIEALVLERELIRKHKPRFNIMLKDDKNYALLKIKRAKDKGRKRDVFPKLEIVRKSSKDQARYFGPYPSASSLRTTVELINKYFLLRTCPDQVLENRIRPCIQYQIGRCMAPCIYQTESYQQEIENVALFLSGNIKDITERLSKKMWQFAKEDQYEAAAKVRDQLSAIKTAMTSQVVSNVNQKKHQDIIGLSRMGPQVSIVRIKIRNGTWHHSDNYNFSDQAFPSEEILQSFLEQSYEKDPDIPHEIVVPLAINDELIGLSEILEKQAGRLVHFIYPQKGKFLRLVEIANKNAQQILNDQIASNNANDRALLALQQRLNLSLKPVRIECIDISLIQGSEPYGSCVVFINGQPDKASYRTFSIKSVSGMDDFAMIHEVVSRRIKRGIADNNLPDLLLIDGGKGQLKSAIKAIEEANIIVSKDSLFVAGIAKARTQKDSQDSNSINVEHSDERLFVPNESEPIILEAHTFERYLVERIRDEAHRFALGAHRKSRSKRTLHSELLDIPGIGKKRAVTLLRHFGSVKNIKQAQASEIARLIHISEEKAHNMLKLLN
ncbi:MAG: excinuclease ABC subunit UvrC [Myxococcales bacterium]|nr:excinuclease ABC subunit UvrC [Myxococcales bacterium]USN50208.1 MAG: excinuclease ABC subunit UvrC [Myxococcales bacterium]